MSKPFDPEFPGMETLPKASSCQKCGSGEQSLRLNGDASSVTPWKVVCEKCGHSGPYEQTFEKAVGSWNQMEGCRK